MSSVKEILAVLPKLTEKEHALIEKAASVAAKAHEGEKRKSGEPYVNHVLETGKTLAELKMDAETIAAGILHDTLEEGKITAAEIKKEFGDTILFLVSGVSKLGKLKYHGVERHVESLRKLFVAMAHDIRVIIIKLADRLHNIKTLEYVQKEKRARIALETLMIHARIADRLGMGRLKAELEDGAFPYVYPEAYKEVKKIIASEESAHLDRLKKISRSIEKDVAASGVKIVSASYRIKHLYSLWRKLEKKEHDVNKIHDIIALRMIVPSIEDCYRALGAIHGNYQPLPGRIKDYIALPKLNGYRSLHTTIFTGDGGVLEIQIRTKEMHEEAEYGIASHLAYKEFAKKTDKKVIEEKISWTKELLEWQKEAAQAEEFLKHLKVDFFESRVFAFTPKGDAVDLPLGATAIDFAYAIHSDIGDHMAGSKINGKLVPLETDLKQGDIVEIVTKESARPKLKWMESAKTSLAKRHIHSYLEKNKERVRR